MHGEEKNQPDVTMPGTKIGEQVSDLGDGNEVSPVQQGAQIGADDDTDTRGGSGATTASSNMGIGTSVSADPDAQ